MGVGVFKRTDISYLDVFVEVDHLVHAIFASHSCLLYHNPETVYACVHVCVCEQSHTAFVKPRYFDEGF